MSCLFMREVLLAFRRTGINCEEWRHKWAPRLERRALDVVNGIGERDISFPSAGRVAPAVVCRNLSIEWRTGSGRRSDWLWCRARSDGVPENDTGRHQEVWAVERGDLAELWRVTSPRDTCR